MERSGWCACFSFLIDSLAKDEAVPIFEEFRAAFGGHEHGCKKIAEYERRWGELNSFYAELMVGEEVLLLGADGLWVIFLQIKDAWGKIENNLSQASNKIKKNWPARELKIGKEWLDEAVPIFEEFRAAFGTHELGAAKIAEFERRWGELASNFDQFMLGDEVLCRRPASTRSASLILRNRSRICPRISRAK